MELLSVSYLLSNQSTWRYLRVSWPCVASHFSPGSPGVLTDDAQSERDVWWPCSTSTLGSDETPQGFRLQTFAGCQTDSFFPTRSISSLLPFSAPFGFRIPNEVFWRLFTVSLLQFTSRGHLLVYQSSSLAMVTIQFTSLVYQSSSLGLVTTQFTSLVH